MGQRTLHALRYISLFFNCAVVGTAVPQIIGVPLFEGNNLSNNVIAVFAIVSALVGCGFWLLCTFWNAFVLIWEAVRKTPIAPGAVVGMDLFVWLVALAGSAWSWVGLWDANYQLHQSQRYKTKNHYSPAQRDLNVALSAVYGSSFFICFIIHFALFVVGCRHEDLRRKHIKANRAVATKEVNNNDDSANLVKVDEKVAAGV